MTGWAWTDWEWLGEPPEPADGDTGEPSGWEVAAATRRAFEQGERPDVIANINAALEEWDDTGEAMVVRWAEPDAGGVLDFHDPSTCSSCREEALAAAAGDAARVEEYLRGYAEVQAAWLRGDVAVADGVRSAAPVDPVGVVNGRHDAATCPVCRPQPPTAVEVARASRRLESAIRQAVEAVRARLP